MKRTKVVAPPPPISLDIPVHKIIPIDMVFDGKKTTGWVHTHGMNLYGLPELEMRDVHPLYLMTAAGGMLNHIAQYMVDGLSKKNGAMPIKLGETMGMSPNTFVTFKKSEPIDPKDDAENETHFSDERWLVTDVVSHMRCADPRHKHGE